MKITGTAIKLGVFSAVLLTLTGLIIVVFGQLRFDRTATYTAHFSSVSGLKPGQFVRTSGVEVGKVSRVRLAPDGRHIIVDFDVDRTVELFESTTAQIRYADLVGNRYLELQRGQGPERILRPGGNIPITQTQPALDLDALIGGFKPLFRALDPQKVNAIASSLITVFEGKGGTINDILDQTAQLTSALADSDQAIGDVVDNLNTVLRTTVAHQRQFDQTIDNLQQLISGLNDRADPLADGLAHISDAAGTLSDLLADNRPALKDTVTHLQSIQGPLIEKQDQLDDLLTKLPDALKMIGRIGGIYGDFFNFYLCDVTLKINGLQPGGPVRTVKVLQQPSGRCTPK